MMQKIPDSDIEWYNEAEKILSISLWIFLWNSNSGGHKMHARKKGNQEKWHFTSAVHAIPPTIKENIFRTTKMYAEESLMYKAK